MLCMYKKWMQNYNAFRQKQVTFGLLVSMLPFTSPILFQCSKLSYTIIIELHNHLFESESQHMGMGKYGGSNSSFPLYTHTFSNLRKFWKDLCKWITFCSFVCFERSFKSSENLKLWIFLWEPLALVKFPKNWQNIASRHLLVTSLTTSKKYRIIITNNRDNNFRIQWVWGYCLCC